MYVTTFFISYLIELILLRVAIPTVLVCLYVYVISLSLAAQHQSDYEETHELTKTCFIY